MLVHVSCAHCQQPYRVDETKLGRDAPCKKCGKTFRVEAPRPPEPLLKKPKAVEPTPIEEWVEDPPVVTTQRPSRVGLRICYVGLFFLLLSLPAVWATSYSTGAGHSMRMTSHGWWMTIPVLVLLGTVISERKSAEKMEQRTKVAGTCCVLIFLYAASTLFSTMSVGQSTVQSPFGNFSAGIKPGPGILFAMLGAGICMVGQTILLQPHLLKPPQVKSPAESKAD